MKCYIEWKAFFIVFIKHIAYYIKACFWCVLGLSLKPLCHKSKCSSKISVLSYVSTTLCACILKILQVNKTDSFSLLYIPYTYKVLSIFCKKQIKINLTPQQN